MEDPHLFGADTLAILALPADAARYALLAGRRRLVKNILVAHHQPAFEALLAERAVDLLLVDLRRPDLSLDALSGLAEGHLQDTEILAIAPAAPAPGPFGDRLTLLVAGAEPGDDVLAAYLASALYPRVLRRMALLARREFEMAQLLGQTRKGLSSFYHDINNPLSILSGNAQLLLEIGRHGGVADDLLSSLRDIEESSRRLHTELQRIVRMKETIATSGLEPPASPDDTLH